MSLAPAVLDRATQDPQLMALLREQRRRAVRTALLPWCEEALAPRGEAPARHHRLIIDRLQGVCDGTIDRLMIYAPPGSAKSTYGTVLFPAHWFARWGRSAVISASHTGDLAETFGRRVRTLVQENSDLLGYTLSEDTRAAGRWNTSQGGEYQAAGVGMAIAGRRADLIVIDDPVKSREDAENQKERDRTWRWYTGDVYSRMRPGCRIVLIMTRWHEDDLGGRLLRAMHEGGDKWEILDLPALAEDMRPIPGVSPITNIRTRDPLNRKPGEALWPEWEDAAALDRKRRVEGPREWAAKYQQRPSPAEGVLFHVDRIPIVRDAPSPISRVVRSWDLAATELVGTADPDHTCGLLLGEMEDGRWIIMDVVRERRGPMETSTLVKTTATSDGLDTPITLPQDPGQAGKAQAAFLVAALRGHIVTVRTNTGSKATRAMPVVSQADAGNLLMLDRHWTKDLRAELETFPVGLHDDQVDALSDAFNSMVGISSAAEMIAFYQRTAPAPDGTPESSRTIQPPQSLIDVYRVSMAEQLSPVRGCARCGLEITDTRVTDGVDSWHQECFH